MTVPNATVEYVEEDGFVQVVSDQFYDPGLDPASEYARDWVRRNKRPHQPHMAYSCGRPL